MGRKPSHQREPLTLPIVLMIVCTLLSFAGNLVAAAVEAGSVLWLRLLIGVLALAALTLGFYLLWRLQSPLRVGLAPTLIDGARPCKGLVVLVSSGAGCGTAKAAIRYHARVPASLKHVWLVHSQGSGPDALEVMDEIKQEGVYDGSFETVPILDREFGNRPEIVQGKIEDRVFHRLPEGVEEADVIVDVTGGRKATTAGAFLAGLPPGRRIQFVSSEETDDRGRGTQAGEPVEIVLDYQVKRR